MSDNSFSPKDQASVIAMLAAEEASGFDPDLKPVAIPALKIANVGDCDPDSQWYVKGARPGVLIKGNQVIEADHFDPTPYYWRWLWEEKRLIPGEKKAELVATWASEPKDAAYPRGLGYSRTSNGHILLERIEIDLVGSDMLPCRMTLWGSANRRIAETFRQRLSTKRIRDANGRSKEAPLYACRIRIGSKSHWETRDRVEVEVFDPALEIIGVYPDKDGPDLDTLMLGRDLAAKQALIRYPHPDVVPISTLRVVNGPPKPPGYGDPPAPDPDDPGPTPHDDDIPEWMKEPKR